MSNSGYFFGMTLSQIFDCTASPPSPGWFLLLFPALRALAVSISGISGDFLLPHDSSSQKFSGFLFHFLYRSIYRTI